MTTDQLTLTGLVGEGVQRGELAFIGHPGSEILDGLFRVVLDGGLCAGEVIVGGILICGVLLRQFSIAGLRCVARPLGVLFLEWSPSS